jgi:hypothetical protein
MEDHRVNSHWDGMQPRSYSQPAVHSSGSNYTREPNGIIKSNPYLCPNRVPTQSLGSDVNGRVRNARAALIFVHFTFPAKNSRIF